MKKLFHILLTLLIALAGLSAFAEGALQRDVLVLFTSDVHCGVDQNFTYVGLKAVKDAAIDAGNHVLLVDDGDSVQGESIGVLTKGMANIELMNAVGYDVAIAGNHEFDYGMDRFFELVDAAGFPYVSCNFRRDGALVFAPYKMFEFDGVKIAFVGATTPETLNSSTPRYFQDGEGNYIYDFTQSGDGARFYAAVQEAVDGARAEGADYVFLIAHLGNEGACRPYTYADVIGHTSGVDAVLDGHSHDTDKVVMKNRDGEDVIRQACGTKLASIGWLRISAADGALDTGLYNWNNDVSAPELLGVWNSMSVELARATDDIKAQLAEVIGTTGVELTIDDPEAIDDSGKPLRIIRRAETNLGDLCADAFREASGADVALANGGSMRTGISKGEITVDDVLSVYPFCNKVMMAEVSGRQLLDALEWGARVVPEENGAFLHASGLTYQIDTGIESGCARDDNGMFIGVNGEYRVKNVMVGGEPLDLDRTYRVASQSYTLVDHGDGQTAFDGANIIWESDEADYEIVVRYIRDALGGVVGAGYEDPYGQERIVAVEGHADEAADEAGDEEEAAGADDPAAAAPADMTGSAMAEAPAEKALEQVVVLSRHNIRSPLSGSGSALGELTPHQWFEWTSNPSELSLRGAMLETTMGQYFRLWLENEGLFPENYRPEDGAVRFYANAKQRTRATAHYFSAGLLPVVDVEVEQHAEYDTMDPVFTPKLTFVSDAYEADVLEQVAQLGGVAGMAGISAGLRDAMELLMEVADTADSEAYQSGKYGDLLEDGNEMILTLDDEPKLSGPIKTGTSLADALTLQYYEEPDEVKAAFGHELTIEDWQLIHTIVDTYSDILFTTPLVSVNVAHPLLEEIRSELCAEGRKFSFLCGHDSNVASVLAALGVEDYLLPEAIEQHTPIGVKLVFERWRDAEGAAWYDVSLVYQSVDQLRGITPLSLDTPPVKYRLSFEGVDMNEDGLIAEADFLNLLDGAINAYDALVEKYGAQEDAELAPVA